MLDRQQLACQAFSVKNAQKKPPPEGGGSTYSIYINYDIITQQKFFTYLFIITLFIYSLFISYLLLFV